MPRRTIATFAVALAALGAPLAPFAAAPATAADAASEAAADRAAAWLATQQLDDGGFETARFPGFETPDAILAIADAAQTGATWSVTEARTAIQARVRNGRTPLDWADDFAEGRYGGALSPGQAGKVVSLVALPLGLPVRAFDPSGDGQPVDLVAAIRAGDTRQGGYGPFFDVAVAVIALRDAGEAVPGALVTRILSAQQGNGGWNFAGDPAPKDDDGNPDDAVDPDSTAIAVQALVAAGLDLHHDALRRALGFFLASELPEGGWRTEFSAAVDPNSTAVVVQALTALGFDADTHCWRQVADRTDVTPGPSPLAVLRDLQLADGRVASPNDSFGVNTSATSQATQAWRRGWRPNARAAAPRCPGQGYRLVARDGGVFAFGDAGFFGSTGGIRLNEPIVGSDDTPLGLGYVLFAADGGVFAFGDAGFYGSAGSRRLNQPIVGGAMTPSGRGYWLFARDGGVFAYGDAGFFGSTGGIRLNQPIVAGASTPTGRGYWLFAADGGVFAFGDAAFFGSAGSLRLVRPVTAAVPTRTGRGYWLFAADGGVFAYGDARFAGSVGGGIITDVVGATAGSTTGGYALARATGEVLTFGDVVHRGDAGSARPVQPIVGID